MRFQDRRDAGRRLAARLQHLASQRPIVVGLPRGGIPVAHEVAIALSAPLDVLVVRKIGLPWQPELGIGALGEEGVRVWNEQLLASTNVPRDDLAAVVRHEETELTRRVRRYRGDLQPLPVAGRTVIVVDDGLATGSTARAGVEVLRRRGASRIVLAVPVAPAGTARELGSTVDEFVCLHSPAEFWAIGAFYDDFSQTSDDEVADLLADVAARSTARRSSIQGASEDVDVEIDGLTLPGVLHVPSGARGLVLFAHGSGSGRRSPRNVAVSRHLDEAGIATLLLDLLTPDEESDPSRVFDVELLASRLLGATRWVRARADLAHLPLGYFGASTGAAAALWAATRLGPDVAAVVSRGGRPDLAAAHLGSVTAPTLLIVGSRDPQVLDLNQQARRLLRGLSELVVVQGASHLFEEPGALEQVSQLARDWFSRHLVAAPRAS